MCQWFENKLRRALVESDYDGLEDADKFRRSGFLPHDATLQQVFSSLQILARETQELQTNWDRQRAQSIVRSLRTRAHLLDMLTTAVDHGIDEAWVFSDEQIIEAAGPVIRRVAYKPAVIYIQFPNGETWEYLVYEDKWLKDILKRHGRNVGRVVTALKKLGVEAQKMPPK
jgi:hypothetical protein